LPRPIRGIRLGVVRQILHSSHISTSYRLPGGGRLTIAEYDIRTAGGTRLEGSGFTPDYRVPAATEPHDAALAKALELVGGKRGLSILRRLNSGAARAWDRP